MTVKWLSLFLGCSLTLNCELCKNERALRFKTIRNTTFEIAFQSASFQLQTSKNFNSFSQTRQESTYGMPVFGWEVDQVMQKFFYPPAFRDSRKSCWLGGLFVRRKTINLKNVKVVTSANNWTTWNIQFWQSGVLRLGNLPSFPTW